MIFLQDEDIAYEIGRPVQSRQFAVPNKYPTYYPSSDVVPRASVWI